jgi:hypothetical protein
VQASLDLKTTASLQMERSGAELVERSLWPVDIILSASMALCVWSDEQWSDMLNKSTQQEEQDALLALVRTCCRITSDF